MSIARNTLGIVCFAMAPLSLILAAVFSNA
jgi:hypothetical protein